MCRNLALVLIMNSTGRTQRVLTLGCRLTQGNLKYKGSCRNSNVIHKCATNITNFVNVKNPEFTLVRRAYCTLQNVDISLNDPNVKKYLDKILKEYKYCAVGKTESLKQLFKIPGVVGLLEDRIKLEENLKSLDDLVSANDKEMNCLVDEEKEIYIEKLKAVELDVYTTFGVFEPLYLSLLALQDVKYDAQILRLLIPKEDFEDCSDVVLEITAGVGGQEAMLFAKDLFNMYSGYIQYKEWASELAHYESTDIGGVRQASLLISGQDVYQYLQFEGGVHRVQRIPSTEKSGRIHTSTVTVAVLPQPDEVDVVLHDKDLKIETKRASGAGGQHVNTTDSAVRIVHIPTGITVECQAERSQIKNKKIAMQQLRAKIYEIQIQKQLKEIQSSRKSQVGSSGRSEKIRTYNFNQDRITDHRLNINTYNMESFLKGDVGLDHMIYQLIQKEKNERIKEFIESLCI